jgi:hypothetical protein
MQIQVYSRLKICFHDPFLEENQIWKAMRVDQIRCQDKSLRPKKSLEKIKRDCVVVLVHDDIDEGHQRFDFAQAHLFFEFVIDGKKHQLALLRYFKKQDNERHVTGLVRLQANAVEKAEIANITSIVR